MLQIEKLLIEAMKLKGETDEQKAAIEIQKNTIRSIKSEILKWKTAKENVGKTYTDEAEITILKKMVKQREDSATMYAEAVDKASTEKQKQTAFDNMTKERAEMQILKQFLPEEVSADRLEAVMKELIRDNFAEPIKKNMGLFVKQIKSAFPGADGKLVASTVQKYLN